MHANSEAQWFAGHLKVKVSSLANWFIHGSMNLGSEKERTSGMFKASAASLELAVPLMPKLKRRLQRESLGKEAIWRTLLNGLENVPLFSAAERTWSSTLSPASLLGSSWIIESKIIESEFEEESRLIISKVLLDVIRWRANETTLLTKKTGCLLPCFLCGLLEKIKKRKRKKNECGVSREPVTPK